MRQPGTGRMGLILAVVVTALLFDPVRKWIQDRVTRPSTARSMTTGGR